jgi:hypothetical protein
VSAHVGSDGDYEDYAAWFAKFGVELMLVRPDFYVFFRLEPV